MPRPRRSSASTPWTCASASSASRWMKSRTSWPKRFSFERGIVMDDRGTAAVPIGPGDGAVSGWARVQALGRSRAVAWILVLLAGGLEVGFALSLKGADGFTRFWPSVGAMAFGG